MSKGRIVRQLVMTPIGYKLSTKLETTKRIFEIVFPEKSHRVKGESKYFGNVKIVSVVFVFNFEHISNLFLVFLFC